MLCCTEETKGTLTAPDQKDSGRMTEKPISLDEFCDCLLVLRRRVEFLAACLEDLANEIRREENRFSNIRQAAASVDKREEAV